MKLFFIRHGEPDYTTDTLTEKGKWQAECVAKRLMLTGVDEIHSSPMGRAVESAKSLSKLTGISVTIEAWARELGKESQTDYPDGKMTTMSLLPATYFHDQRYRGLGLEESFDIVEGLQGSEFKSRYHSIAEGLDGLLARCGYMRNEAGFYDVVSPNDRQIVLFCHAGMQRVMLSHLFHIPYQFFAASLWPDHASITTLHFENDELSHQIMPKLTSFGDVGHYK